MLSDYIKTEGDVYIFPVGFIETYNVFDTNFYKNYNGWCQAVIYSNKTKEVGIKKPCRGGADSYIYYTEREIQCTHENKIYVSSNGVLGGL